ncbi:MAG TPA: aminodeoxychorismate/anthranilate synthase component II [Candidatus Mediterraneibacter intestinigallinarum]|nr:aminodeoxychorismate/anthranilate synthase component II [Candidatus Mediterraneibacter intestinigallinarum]
MILLIDNYDSFVYNLYQFLAVEDPDVRLVRNDRITPEEALSMEPDAIVISPGPGKPSDAGVCIELIRQLKGRIPILGVCLGHQAIGEAFGATVTYASRLMHGKTSLLTDVADDIIFKGIKKPAQVARYHSLSVQESTLPEELEVTARSDDGEIMAMRHREYPIYGLQFHPESVMTPEGSAMIRNFLEAAGTAVNGSIDQKPDR